MKNLVDIKIDFQKKIKSSLTEKELIIFLKLNFIFQNENEDISCIGCGSIHSYIYTSEKKN
jgi:hypothetical protein